MFDVQDISSVIYACPHCGYEAVCAIKGKSLPPTHCGSCNKPLTVPDQQNGLDPSVTQLHNLRALLKKTAPDRVRFRFVVPDLED